MTAGARVVEVRTEECWHGEAVLVLVEPCPYCGRHHVHGAGGGEGFRSSHCSPGGSYDLRLTDEQHDSRPSGPAGEERGGLGGGAG